MNHQEEWEASRCADPFEFPFQKFERSEGFVAKHGNPQILGFLFEVGLETNQQVAP